MPQSSKVDNCNLLTQVCAFRKHGKRRSGLSHVHLQLRGTSHALFIEAVDPVWHNGCLGHVGSRVVNHQGYP